MNTDEKAIEIYNIFYKKFIKDGYPDEIATTCAIGGKAGAEVMAEWKDEQHGVAYVVTRCEEHSDYVEEVFFDIEKAEQYCAKYNSDEDNYRRHITKVNVTL